MPNINVAWWNLENLIDHQNAPRDEDLKKILKSELKGWTAAVRDRKILQLAKIIKMMFNGAGPSILGVCEVENEDVVQKLADASNIPGRNYSVVSHESHDARGIDTSFIIDKNELKTKNSTAFGILQAARTRMSKTEYISCPSCGRTPCPDPPLIRRGPPLCRPASAAIRH